MNDWFTADRQGLRQIHERLVERRGFGLIGGELYQNVMDTDATECLFTIERVPNKPRITVVCEDDGHGFKDLSHAWRMFAPSEKKGDPTKAGRFNLGEKVVLSFAHSAQIYTTSGTVIFDNDTGRKNQPRRKRECGTWFSAELAAKREYFDQLIEYMHKIIVRPGLKLVVNGEIISHREPLATFEHPLPTEIGDDLRRTVRKTEVQVYEPLEGETPILYELGIPVVETGDKWHVSIQQKVPLNTDRDNVTPAYLRQVRVAVFNHMHHQIEEDDTNSTWVNEASSDPKCDPEAAATFMHKKYGERSLASDPFNPESDGEALSKGWTVIPSRGLTTGQRDNLKGAGVLETTSSKFPNHYNAKKTNDWKHIEPTSGMLEIAEYVEGLGERLLGFRARSEFITSPKITYAASYSCKTISFNVTILGEAWFDRGAVEDVDRLIIHELAHQFEGNHSSYKYQDACCRLAARLKKAALDDPNWFRRFMHV